MKLSPHQKKNIYEKKVRALKLYETGMTTREVGMLLDRSHTWVEGAVRELTITPEKLSTSDDLPRIA